MKNSRREFLRVSALAATGALLLPEGVRSALAMKDVSRYDKMGLRKKVKNIGIQLYSVRQDMLADAAGTLKKLAAIGYKELESARSEKGNYYGLGPKEIKKITQGLGMRLRSGHIHVDGDFQRSIDQAVETGQEYLISAVLPSPGQTVDNYQRAADAFNKAGETCKKANLSFGYHNHNWEFEKVDGRPLYDVLLERTDPSLVKMEMDLGWVIAAGNDPLEYFTKYPGRFPLWHLKDMDPVKKQSTEFGNGQVDVVKILQHAGDSGMKHFFVEQEEYAHTAFESVRIDYDYLAKLDY